MDSDKKRILKKIQKKLEEQYLKPTAKETVVMFDKSTNPFEVRFSERGFEVQDTRFSFEFLETALSKDVNIVLNNGQGLVLDSIKMEKILKYKNLY
jgi:hypothetical protein